MRHIYSVKMHLINLKDNLKIWPRHVKNKLKDSAIRPRDRPAKLGITKELIKNNVYLLHQPIVDEFR
jgi:hypothetical protein